MTTSTQSPAEAHGDDLSDDALRDMARVYGFNEYEHGRWVRSTYKPGEIVALLRAAMAGCKPQPKGTAKLTDEQIIKMIDEDGRGLACEFVSSAPVVGIDAAIEAIRVALEAAQSPAPAPEPVAWCQLAIGGKTIAYFDGKPMVMVGPMGNHIHTTPLYLHPTQAPAVAPGLVPLTEAQAIKLWHENTTDAHRRQSAFEWFAAGIISAERAHGIGVSNLPVQGKQS